MSQPDLRRHSPPAQRNREPIVQVLREILPASGIVLMIAEGSGEHVVHFARAFPALAFQPSDPDPEARASIAAWTAHEGLANILPPLALDAASGGWPIQSADTVVCINMIHISPWAATQGLLRGAAQALQQGAPLFLYGPYKRNGQHTSQSNADFDASLKSRNSAWGIRDLETVDDCARRNRFDRLQIFEMPANNFSVVWRRQ